MPITSEPTPHRPPAGTARVRFSGTYSATSWMNGFWLLTTGAPLFSDVSTLSTDLYGAYETRFLGLCSSDFNLARCDVELFTGGGSIVAATLASHSGGGGTNYFPSSAAVVIKWEIEAVYRGGKPRTYLGGQERSSSDTNHVWSDAHVSACSAGAVGFLNDVNGMTTPNIDSVSLGVVHFFSGGLALDPPTFDPFLGAGAQKRVCSQRRRLGREL